MELNKEIEVFTDVKTEDLPQKPKQVQQPTQTGLDKIQTPPKPAEKPLATSNEVAVVNSNTDQALAWSKEKTGPERVSTFPLLLSVFICISNENKTGVGIRYQ